MVWYAITQELDTEIEEVKKKMSNLLGSFRRKRSKGKKSVGTGKCRYLLTNKIKLLNKETCVHQFGKQLTTATLRSAQLEQKNMTYNTQHTSTKYGQFLLNVCAPEIKFNAHTNLL